MKENENTDGSVKEALRKCAVGFDTREIVEEFAVQDGELVLVRKKVTKRDVPPDIKAVKMLLDDEQTAAMTDGELLAEREKLIKMLKEDNFD